VTRCYSCGVPRGSRRASQLDEAFLAGYRKAEGPIQEIIEHRIAEVNALEIVRQERPDRPLNDPFREDLVGEGCGLAGAPGAPSAAVEASSKETL